MSILSRLKDWKRKWDEAGAKVKKENYDKWLRNYVVDLSHGFDYYVEWVQCNNCRHKYNLRQAKTLPLPSRVTCPNCKSFNSYRKAEHEITSIDGW